MNRFAMLCGASVFALTCVTGSQAQAADKTDPKSVEFFEANIRPILAQSCVGCHGAEKQKGGLRLDTREGLLAGGKEEAKVIVVFDPKAPDKSMVSEAIHYKNDDLAMPPPNKKVPRKLPDDKIAAMDAWLKAGAVYGEKPVEAPAKKP